MESTMRRVPRTISIFSLAMINLAAISAVKNWPLTAEYGFASLFFLLLAALIFFLPVSFVSAELATGWPKIGGIYAWVREAFGHRAGFLAIWLLWIENAIWYPTILSFIAATLAYIFDPTLAQNSGYNVAIILIAFWSMTLLNMLGMRISAWISTVGVIAGTFIPGVLIIILGYFWYTDGHPLQITMNWESLFPNFRDLPQLVFFTGVIFNFAGIEMSSVHARDVKNPQRDYPRAILLSVILIVGLSALGVLSIAMVVPQKDIVLTAGSMQAFTLFLANYNLTSLVPWVAAFVFLGGIGSLSTWIVGPSKGLLAAAQGGDLPPFMRKVNKHGMPIPLLVIQGVIVSIISLMFVLMPTISSAFWLITTLVAQVYLIMYVMMFVSAIRLRYTRAHVKRAYRVPGGNIGMWIVAGVGTLTCTFTFLIGFWPPEQIATGGYAFYLGFLIIGIIVVCLAPYIILKFKKPSWNHVPEESNN